MIAHEFAVDIADLDAVRVERVHDVCLVRPTEISDGAAVAGHSALLGHRVLRILLCGAGEPHWPYSVFRSPAEDDAGGDHAGRVRRLLGDVSGRTAPLESRGGLRLPRARGLFRIQEMSVTQPMDPG